MKIRRIKIKNFIYLLFSFIFLASLIPYIGLRAAGASIYLTPAVGTHVIGSRFSVRVKINSGGEVVNAAEGSLSFNSKLIQVIGISKSGSIFSLWTTEPIFSNSAGTISFGGGIPRPGYKGKSGQVCTITFRAKKVGSAQVRFVSGAVLANDGKGTNILASMGSGNYTISAAVENTAPTKASKQKKEEKEEYNKPKIISSTHPDQNTWYNISDIKFKWELPKNVEGVSIAFDQKSEVDPGPKSDGLFGEKEYKNTADGIWYLHLKFKDSRRWGTIANYRVMVDTKPPKDFQIKVKTIKVGDWPELIFNAKDDLSGLKQYKVIVGSLEEKFQTVNPDSPVWKIKGLKTGEHTAMAKAIDKAGNEVYKKISFTVKPIAAPIIINYPKEIKSSDKFYVSGTALPNVKINIFIHKEGELKFNSTTESDGNGHWFYLDNSGRTNGRYVVWTKAINSNGIESNPSEKVSFLVTPPVFTRIGSFVVNYFTVFVSLLFVIILIIILVVFIIGLFRKRLKKETIEIEDVLHKNLQALNKVVDKEITAMSKITKSSANYKKEKLMASLRLKKSIDQVEKKTLKEIKDVEDILK